MKLSIVYQSFIKATMILLFLIIDLHLLFKDTNLNIQKIYEIVLPKTRLLRYIFVNQIVLTRNFKILSFSKQIQLKSVYI